MKTFGKIWNAITTALVVVVVLLALMLAGPRVIGMQVFTVLSGSMEPTYHTGSLIYVKDVDPSEVQVNDVITLVLPDETPATHRVVRIDKENQCFYTKGDANKTEDAAPVYYKNLIGKLVYHLNVVG